MKDLAKCVNCKDQRRWVEVHPSYAVTVRLNSEENQETADAVSEEEVFIADIMALVLFFDNNTDGIDDFDECSSQLIEIRDFVCSQDMTKEELQILMDFLINEPEQDIEMLKAQKAEIDAFLRRNRHNRNS